MVAQQNICYECHVPIKFDANILSPKGRLIPLELDGSLHNCPFKPNLIENWGMPTKQYQKLHKQQHQQLQPDQTQLFDLSYTIEDRLQLVEKQVSEIIQYIREQQQKQSAGINNATNKVGENVVVKLGKPAATETEEQQQDQKEKEVEQ